MESSSLLIFLIIPVGTKNPRARSGSNSNTYKKYVGREGEQTLNNLFNSKQILSRSLSLTITHKSQL